MSDTEPITNPLRAIVAIKEGQAFESIRQRLVIEESKVFLWNYAVLGSMVTVDRASSYFFELYQLDKYCDELAQTTYGKRVETCKN